MPKQLDNHKQITIYHREGEGSVVKIGNRSRFFSLSSFGEDHKSVASLFYALLGIKMGYFYPPEKANQFFVRPAIHSKKKPKYPVFDLCRYVLSEDGLYTKVEIFRKYSTKDAERRALIDLNLLNKQNNGQITTT